MEGIRGALVLGLVLIAETGIEHAPSVGFLEYASSIWSPLASPTSINKLRVIPNATLRTATGYTQYTNMQHLHDETLILPIHDHLQLHVLQYKQNTTYITPLTQTYNKLHHSNAKKTLSLTTAATQQTFPQTPTQSLQQT